MYTFWVSRSLSLDQEDYQRVYIFVDLDGGLDPYVQRTARDRDDIL